MLGAGVYLSIVRLPQFSDLWTTGYGRVLLVKLGLVGLALTWGAVHHFVARPALERGSYGPILSRLPRSLAGESAVGMAILLAAAVLVESKPPPRPATSPPVALERPGDGSIVPTGHFRRTHEQSSRVLKSALQATPHASYLSSVSPMRTMSPEVSRFGRVRRIPFR